MDIFNEFDADKNGFLDSDELRTLVATCGFIMNNRGVLKHAQRNGC